MVLHDVEGIIKWAVVQPLEYLADFALYKWIDNYHFGSELQVLTPSGVKIPMSSFDIYELIGEANNKFRFYFSKNTKGGGNGGGGGGPPKLPIIKKLESSLGLNEQQAQDFYNGYGKFNTPPSPERNLQIEN
ncbi:MAG: hypothetical protein R3E32_14010 [Chitinophagales bacterium]